MIWLAISFALTALLYASVGFGGGSTYNALLALSGVDYRILPSIALICNIIVVSGGSFHFVRSGQVPWSRLWPILLLSAPCAWLGGKLMVSQPLFMSLLAAALFCAAMLMLFQKETAVTAHDQSSFARRLSWSIGMLVGFVSGMVGIGGGIFLAPILHILRWASPRQIAGAASVFILVNSIAGLIGQYSKIAGTERVAEISGYWPLMLSVFMFGQVGSLLGARILPLKWVRIGTAILILYVAARLSLQLL